MRTVYIEKRAIKVSVAISALLLSFIGYQLFRKPAYHIDIYLDKGVDHEKVEAIMQEAKDRFHAIGLDLIVKDGQKNLELPKDNVNNFNIPSREDLGLCSLVFTNNHYKGFCGQAYVLSNKAVIAGVDNFDLKTNVEIVQHELGHLLGLGHSNDNIMMPQGFQFSYFRAEDIETMINRAQQYERIYTR